jgi:uncharacterized beta barrel domain-containing protein DUF5777
MTYMTYCLFLGNLYFSKSVVELTIFKIFFMKKAALLICLFFSLEVFSQVDTTKKVVDTTIIDIPDTTIIAGIEEQGYKVFYSQRLINSKTVEVLRKGVLAFSVIHNFGDIASKTGGFHNFFGLDDISDAQIGFQLGLTNRLNLVLNHTVGYGAVRKFYEGGLKYQFTKQQPQGFPFSLTVYTNAVISADKIPQDSAFHLIPGRENSFETGSDRMSYFTQLMIAKRFGNVSIQLSPAYLHRNLVVEGDQNDLFAVGAALRLPVTKRIVIIADYFHTFRNDSSTALWRSKGIDPHDVFGIGLEFLTWGHVFHLNFTNARNILENRFLTQTGESWGDGEFRWGFTLVRNFTVWGKKN